MEKYAEMMRTVRTRQGLTLAELSARTGIGASRLSEIESGGKRGQPDAETRLVISLALNVPERVIFADAPSDAPFPVKSARRFYPNDDGVAYEMVDRLRAEGWRAIASELATAILVADEDPERLIHAQGAYDRALTPLARARGRPRKERV